MKAQLLYKGRMFTVYALVEDGRVLYEEFLKTLTAVEQAKVEAVVTRVGDHGTPTNRER